MKAVVLVWVQGVRVTWRRSLLCTSFSAPNGLRYPLVGGTRQRYFNGTHFKPRKLPENAQTPTSRVHAVLGVFVLRTTPYLKNGNTDLTQLHSNHFSAKS